MKAIILAAGYATRLYPLTKDKAKALLPVQGRPIIDYIVEQIETLPAVDHIYVVCNHLFYNQFVDWTKQRQAEHNTCFKLPLSILDDGSTSEADKLGAIGDIQFCIEQEQINDDLLVIAGDNLFTYSLYDAWKTFARYHDDMIMARRMPKSSELNRLAIAEVDDEGIVTGLVEKPSEPKTDIAVFATYFYRQDTLPLIRQYLESGQPADAPGNFPVWLHSRKRVRVFMFDGICIDIGTPESYEDVRTTFPRVRQSKTE